MKKIYVISSKKFTSLKSAFAQMYKWELNGTLNRSAVIYEVKNIEKYKKTPKVKIKRFKNGGYVKEEKFDDGIITLLSMDSRGWYEEFAKPLMKKK